MLTRAGCSIRAAREWTVEQTRRPAGDAVLEALRQNLRAGPAGGFASIQYRAAAVLYTLLLDHPLDQRGRCQSCRRSGAMIGPRRRPCRIHLRARYWLRQPDEALPPWHLAIELGLGGGGPDGRAPTLFGAPWPR